jgi:acetyl esterase/lipase
VIALVLAGCGLDGPVPRPPAENEKPAQTPAPSARAATAGQPQPASSPPAGEAKPSLAEARRGFTTKLLRRESAGEPLPQPPAGIMQLVQYESPAGKLNAYLTPAPKDGKKHPAIVWITGSDCNSRGETCWTEGPPSNDQSASAFRKAGLVVMFPGLRGGNDNPGYKEGMYGELDDVLAAANFLAGQTFVDPKRIYLGGHSTGGTLVLLAAEYSDRFRAVFSFGPASSVAKYGRTFAVYDTSDQRETVLRSPAFWLHSIRIPTFVFEGAEQQSNVGELERMSRLSKNPLVQFYPITGVNRRQNPPRRRRNLPYRVFRRVAAAGRSEFTEFGRTASRGRSGSAWLPLSGSEEERRGTNRVEQANRHRARRHDSVPRRLARTVCCVRAQRESV